MYTLCFGYLTENNSIILVLSQCTWSFGGVKAPQEDVVVQMNHSHRARQPNRMNGGQCQDLSVVRGELAAASNPGSSYDEPIILYSPETNVHNTLGFETSRLVARSFHERTENRPTVDIRPKRNLTPRDSPLQVGFETHGRYCAHSVTDGIETDGRRCAHPTTACARQNRSEITDAFDSESEVAGYVGTTMDGSRRGNPPSRADYSERRETKLPKKSAIRSEHVLDKHQIGFETDGSRCDRSLGGAETSSHFSAHPTSLSKKLKKTRRGIRGGKRKKKHSSALQNKDTPTDDSDVISAENDQHRGVAAPMTKTKTKTEETTLDGERARQTAGQHATVNTARTKNNGTNGQRQTQQ